MCDSKPKPIATPVKTIITPKFISGETNTHTRKNYYHTKIYQRRDKHPLFANPLARENTMERARGCPQHSATPLVQLCKHARSRLANKHAIKVCRMYNISANSKSFARQTTQHITLCHKTHASTGHPAASSARFCPAASRSATAQTICCVSVRAFCRLL